MPNILHLKTPRSKGHRHLYGLMLTLDSLVFQWNVHFNSVLKDCMTVGPTIPFLDTPARVSKQCVYTVQRKDGLCVWGGG